MKVLPDLVKLLWKNHQGALESLREVMCARYCPICGDNCCTGRLNPSISDLRAFPDLRRVRYRWDRKPEGPYLVDRRFLFFGTCYLVNGCPHLKGNLCAIHEEAARPRECHEYPLYLDFPFSIPFFKPFISVELSCGIFRYKKNCDEVSQLGERLGLEVIFHETPP
ncbi:MAG: hypothetical protein RDV48_15325 [Candidatus Eremiobacteraeota bacterium]|nr:hypothetical protein [Candidatus Eremiobacteraeota bacterium]